MPAPAAQFSPALPWAPGTRGTILLQEPVSKEDLINGALTFINSNGYLYQPEGNDGYVDYIDENKSAEISIAIDDEGTTSVLKVGVSVDANVQRVVVGPAVGNVRDYVFRTDAMQIPQTGDTCFLLAECVVDGQTTYCALTQDGRNVIKGERVEISGEGDTAFQIFQSANPVPATSLLKISSGQATGQIASLPKVLIEPHSEDNNFSLLILHAPSNGGVYGTVVGLTSNGNDPVYWGDSVTNLYV